MTLGTLFTVQMTIFIGLLMLFLLSHGAKYAIYAVIGVFSLLAIAAVLVALNLLSIYLKCGRCNSYGLTSSGYVSGCSRPSLRLDCPKCGRVVMRNFEEVTEKPFICHACGHELGLHEKICPKCRAKIEKA